MMTMIYEYLVIAAYFALIFAISIIFKKAAAKSTSDYFRGGGKMLWWMVGSTAFMAQFSAVTFTGVAGKAFTDGFGIMAMTLANAVAFGMSYLWFARRFRQVRVDTPTEAIRRRYGAINEQFFTWTIIPMSMIQGAVWLNGLGVFVSGFLGIDLMLAIVVTGVTVLIVSLLSGAWGVVASDFIQTLVICVVSVACAIIALAHIGGPSKMISEFPSGFFIGSDLNYPLILLCTFPIFMIKQLQSINNLQDSFRFLNARDSKHADKAALFAMILMGVGAFIWFIPAWCMAILDPNSVNEFSAFGRKAADAVFLIFARDWMPAGAVGLLLAGLFSATMSSMDSSLNRNAGIFVKSFYATIIRKKQAQDKELLTVGKIVSALNGCLVIAIAIFFASLKELSLFDLMMGVGTLVAAPVLVPLCFGMFIKRIPNWSPWCTVILGIGVSWFMMNIFTPQVFADLVGMGKLTVREVADMRSMMAIVAHLVITAGFFCLTTLFYKETEEIKQREEEFFNDIETEVVATEGISASDSMQRMRLGSLVLAMSIGVSLMVLIPNPLWGRLVFALSALALGCIGMMLRKGAQSEITNNS